MQEDYIDLEGLRDDDADAWTDAWPVLYTIAYAAAWQALRDQEEAKDVASEAVIALRKHIDQIQDNDHLRDYLAKAARRKSINLIKKMLAQIRDKRLTESLEAHKNECGEFDIAPANVPPPGSLSDKEDLIKDLVFLLNLLGNPCQFLLIQVFWEDVRPAELAAELELNAATIAMRAVRCLDKALKIAKANPTLLKRLKDHLR